MDVLCTYCESIAADPASGRELVQSGDEEHETSIPVRDQHHHRDQIHYLECRTGHVK